MIGPAWSNLTPTLKTMKKEKLSARPWRLCLGLFAALAIYAASADAHVKWFASWNIICPPRDPMRIFASPLWRWLGVACVVSMTGLAWLDWRLQQAAGGRFQAACMRLHAVSAPKAVGILRVGVAIYWLLAAFTLPHAVYLTPELAAPAWVSWLQLALALLVLRRATAWLAGVGMLALYGLAIADYGWFHLLDYPLFAAVGIILVLSGRGQDRCDALGLTILRWGAGITIFWGGIEKFTYPEWSFPLLLSIPSLSLGVKPETAMYVYGFGEIAFAYGLLVFGAGSQVAALLLLAIFLSAVAPFGWVDLVGHSGICVALLILSLTRTRTPILLRTPASNAVAHGLLFSALTAIYLFAYFGLHRLHLHHA